MSLHLCGSGCPAACGGEDILLQDWSHFWENFSLHRRAYQRTLRSAFASTSCSPPTPRLSPHERILTLSSRHVEQWCACAYAIKRNQCPPKSPWTIGSVR